MTSDAHETARCPLENAGDIPFFPFERTDPATLSPMLRRLSEQGPVSRALLPSGQVAVLVTGTDEVKAVLAVREFSCAAAADAAATPFIPFVRKYRSLLSLDPPEHTTSRRLITRFIGPETVRRLAPRIAEFAEERVAALKERGGVSEIVGDYFGPLTELTMQSLTGVPTPDIRKLHSLFNAAMNINKFDTEAVAASFAELDLELEKLIAERKAEPRNDLLTAMIGACNETGASHEALVGALVTVLIAGISTPDTVLTLGLVALLRHRAQWRLLGENTDLIPQAVEEILRYCPPVEVEHLRVSTTEVRLVDTNIPAGTPVLTSVAAANFDPRVFADPDKFDVRRSGNRHLTFGHGIHACPGSAIARALLVGAFTALIRHFPDLRMVDESELRTQHEGIHSFGLSQLHVRW